MLNVQIHVTNNSMINEKIATARLVNQQAMTFDDFCSYIAEGSTVTSADVSAVMKRIETLLPMLLSLNTKITASPAGLIFRTGIKGRLTQSELKERLIAKRDEMIANGDSAGAAKVDINRKLQASDLAVSELTPVIEVNLPTSWSDKLQQTALIKRVTRTTTTVEEPTTPSSSGNNPSSSGNTPTTPPSGGSGTNSDL